MARPLFNRIVIAVINHDAYFHNNVDCTGRKGISTLIKCTSAIRQLAYGVNASFLDEYMQISERSSRMALDHFCEAVMDIYGPEYLRKPTVTDIEKKLSASRRKAQVPGDVRNYPSEYYLVDGIYPELAPLVKKVPKPADDNHKRISYKKKQESARKDVKRSFGVLKKKWVVLEAHQPEDLLRYEEQVEQVMRWIGSSQVHQNLRHDLIEHLSRNV
ncbi:serine/threonine-protein kinase STY17-like protein [Tanacetum coccineum]